MKHTGPLSGKTHCEYCMCPIEVWNDEEPLFKTYSGDGCKLFDEFSSLIEYSMTAAELAELAIIELPKEFSDIEDISATVKELMDIILDCGVLDDPYPSTPAAPLR